MRDEEFYPDPHDAVFNINRYPEGDVTCPNARIKPVGQAIDHEVCPTCHMRFGHRCADSFHDPVDEPPATELPALREALYRVLHRVTSPENPHELHEADCATIEREVTRLVRENAGLTERLSRRGFNGDEG